MSSLHKLRDVSLVQNIKAEYSQWSIFIFKSLRIHLEPFFLAIIRIRSACGGVGSAGTFDLSHNIPCWSHCWVSGGRCEADKADIWWREAGPEWGQVTGRGNIDIISPDMPRDNQPYKCAARAGVIVCLYADLPSRMFVGITPCTAHAANVFPVPVASVSTQVTPWPEDYISHNFTKSLKYTVKDEYIFYPLPVYICWFVRSMSFIFCLNYGSWIRRISHVNLVLLSTMNNCLPMSGWIWRWEAPEHEEIRNWDIMKSGTSLLETATLFSFQALFAARLLLTMSHWLTGELLL